MSSNHGFLSQCYAEMQTEKNTDRVRYNKELSEAMPFMMIDLYLFVILRPNCYL